MKRFIMVFAVILGLLIPAYGASALYAVEKDNHVTVEGTITGQRTSNTVTLALVQFKQEGMTDSDIGYIAQSKIDDNGKYRFDFIFKGNIEEYGVLVRCGEELVMDSVDSAVSFSTMECDWTEYNDGYVTVKTRVDNRSINAGDKYFAAVGVYDNSGNLKRVATRTGTATEETAFFDIKLDFDDKNDTVKGFIWLEEMIPIYGGLKEKIDGIWESYSIRSKYEADNNLAGGEGAQIVQCMDFSPDGKTVFMGVDTIAVYRSDDGGKSWKWKSSGINAGFCKSIKIDKDNPTRVYALIASSIYNKTHEGLYVSNDNGDNWVFVKKFDLSNTSGLCHVLAVENGKIYVGAADGLYMSENGTDFTKIISGISVWALRVHNGVAYVGHSGGISSYNNGTITGLWNEGNLCNALDIDTKNNILYAVLDKKDVIKYDLNSMTLKNINNNLPNLYNVGMGSSGSIYDLQVHPANPNKIMLGLSWVDWAVSSPYLSEDGGANWTLKNNKVYTGRFIQYGEDGEDRYRGLLPELAFAPVPGNENAWLKSFNYGAVYRTEDNCATWHWSNEGYNGTLSYNIAVNPKFPQHFVIAAHDLGPYVTFDGGKSFTQSYSVTHGKIDPMGICIIPGTTPETSKVYVGIGRNTPYSEAALEVSTDGGLRYTDVSGTYKSDEQIWRIFQHNNVIYAGRLFSTDNGASWQKTVDTTASLVSVSSVGASYKSSFLDNTKLALRTSMNLKKNGSQIKLVDESGNEYMNISYVASGTKNKVILKYYENGVAKTMERECEAYSDLTIECEISKKHIRFLCDRIGLAVTKRVDIAADKIAIETTSGAAGDITDLTVGHRPTQVIAADSNYSYLYDGHVIYRSTDNGKTVSALNVLEYGGSGLDKFFVKTAVPNSNCTKIYFGSSDGLYIYDVARDTVSYKDEKNGLIKSISGTLHIDAIAVDPNNDNIVYVGESNLYESVGGWVVCSRDGGETFESLPDSGLIGGGKVSGLGFDGDGNLWAMTYNGIIRYNKIK